MTTKRLMRPMSIVKLRVGLHDVVEMDETEAIEVVQAFAFQRADPGLGECVGIRRFQRRLNDLNTCRLA